MNYLDENDHWFQSFVHLPFHFSFHCQARAHKETMKKKNETSETLATGFALCVKRVKQLAQEEV